MKKLVYESMYKHENEYWWHRGFYKISTMLFDRFLKCRNNRNVRKKILDVGCGTGGMFKVLSKYGDVYGIDNSNLAVDYAIRREIAKEVSECDVQHIGYGDNIFDTIICYDVLYHQDVDDDMKVLNECMRVLKPDGYLFLRVAAYDWLRGEHDVLVKTRHRYTKDEIIEKCKLAGGMVCWSSYVNFILFPLALLNRIFEKRNKNNNEVKNIDIFKPLPFGLNKLFTLALFVESYFLNFFTFPYGLSVMVVVRK